MRKVNVSRYILSVFFFVCTQYLIAQSGFKFVDNSKAKQLIKFKLINNLIVIPLEINGKELSFILDTGVNKTILFNLTKNDSLDLKSIEKVTLKGLGTGQPVEAIISKNNTFRLENLISYNQDIYVILKDKFDLSSKMGTTIHGIIGYNLLENLIAEINYRRNRVTFHNPKKFKYKKCSRCETFPIEFKRNKPYINTNIQLDTVSNITTNVNLLIDSGGSDALWLFEDTKPEIKTPNKFFRDVLGEGLSGTIYGNRSRIPKLQLGRYLVEKPTVSFLDSTTTHYARKLSKRNGSIGSNILKRFRIWIDYPNKKITLKKAGSLKRGFNYNMSGLQVSYSGKVLVKEEERKIVNSDWNGETSNNINISSIISYVYRFKPLFKVDNVLKGSPADIAGIKKGDVILKVNGKQSYNLKLSDIIYKFQERDNKRISLVIDRNGIRLKFKFKLKKRI